MRPFSFFASVFFLLFSLCSASLAEKAAFARLELDLLSLYNPLGLSVSANGFYRTVYRHDDSPLWHGLYYQSGLQANLNPAFFRTGFHFELMPVTVLQIRLQYDRLKFSGKNASLLSFASNQDLFGDDELENRAGDEQAGYGNRVLFQFTLRAQFASTIVRNVSVLSSYSFPGPGPYYLEREHEILMAADDELLANKFFLLFETVLDSGRVHRYIGPYHEYLHVKKSDLIQERVGITWYQQYAARLSVFNNPRWYIQAGSYLKDQNREAEIFLIFGIGGDIHGL
ncbi:MAG: hypothetical protein OEY11_03675 [Gammaproteobacteria bacterium]|nr:hypothetical protein [Gammaproteobacteria bacterium]